MGVGRGWRWSRNVSWAALGVALLSAAILTFLILTTAMDKGTGPVAKAFVFGVGAVATVVAFVAARPAVTKGRRRLNSPKAIAILFVAVFTGFGVMTDVLSLLAPPPAVEPYPGEISPRLVTD
jgi:hypothetical protein